jgi:hypothetical protein
MKTHTGKLARIVVATGCSAVALSLSISYSAIAEDSGASTQDAIAPNAETFSTVSPNTVTPNTATPNIATPNTATPNIATPNTATPNTATPNTATPNTTTPNTATPNTATPNTATPNTASPNAVTPNTATPGISNSPSACSTTLDRHKTFVQFIEAVTDKPVPQEIQDLLQGVVSLERKGNDIELTKEDGTKFMAGGDTHFGATVIGDFSEARDKVAAKFGPEVGALIDEFVGVTANGSHLEVIRNGPENEDIDLSEKKLKRQLPLRRVRLSKISVDVDVADSHPVLRNITGIEAVPNAGFEIPIVLKEFSRRKNQDGDDVFTFGVKNPFPILKPLKRLFGLKEIMPLTWTVKKQDSVHKEIGAKEPVEPKE